MTAPRPYPFDTLPRMGRAEVRALRDVVRALPVHAPKAALDAAERILGVRPTLEPTTLSMARAGQLADALSDPLLALCVEEVGGRRSSIAFEIDASLGLSLVDRALGGPGGISAGVATTGMDDARRGVLAYIGAELLAAGGGHARAGAVVTTRTALTAILGDQGAWVWPLRVTLGEERGALRVWIPMSREAPRRQDEGIRPELAALELVGSIVVGEARLSLAEVRALSAGDVLLMDTLSISKPPYTGEASLRFGLGGALRAQCRLADGTLTYACIDLSTGRSHVEGSIMTQTSPTDTQEDAALSAEDTLESLADAPIELTLELGRCSLSLGELSRLRPGEVVLGGQPVGGLITIRAGNRAIARGELVDVEGEIGVRLLEVASDR